ncbi:hypothetical protein PENTCL1PPCAC_15484, partial [Pristionchus entomophagus]
LSCQIFGTCWLYNSNYILLVESPMVRKILQNKFSEDYGIDFLTTYAMLVDVNDESFARQSTIGTFICIAMMQSQILTIVFCGWKIHNAIKIRSMSDKLKRAHGRALNMIISQAMNPLLFLYCPSFINMFGMFVDVDFGDLPKALAMILALFPIVNPIIVIYFTEEYKHYLLNKGQPSVTQTSVVMSKVKRLAN